MTFSATYYDKLFDVPAASTVSGGTSMTSTNFVTASYPQFAAGLTQQIYDSHTASDWVNRASTATVSFSATSSASNTTSERWQSNGFGSMPSVHAEQFHDILGDVLRPEAAPERHGKSRCA